MGRRRMKTPRATAEARPVRQRRAPNSKTAATAAADPATPVPEMPAIPMTPEQILQHAREEAGAPQGPPPPFVPPAPPEPAAPQTVRCYAFSPMADDPLREMRCLKDNEVVLIVGVVPTMYVPLCREHGVEIARSLRARGIYTINGGV